MRKLKIGKEERKKQTWAIVFLVLLTFSTVGYAIVNSFSNSNSSDIDSGDFVREGNFWTIAVGSQKYYFSYLPSQLGNLSVDGEFNLADYYGVPLYFTEDSPGSLEILNNLGRYVERSQNACISEEDCADNLPLKNCSVDNVIVFVEGNVEIRKEDKCVYLVGDSLMAADKFLYEVLKIN
jgi:hypothetical protein